MTKRQIKVRHAKVLEKVEKRNLIIAVFILVILVLGMFYYFAYPRIGFDVETWYSEGFLGSVSVDVTVRNRSPSTLEEASLTITLLNASNEVIASSSNSNFTIQPWETFSTTSLHISGVEMGNNTHFDIFKIVVNLSFTSGSYREYNFEYTTEGEHMNLFFSDRVGRFIV